MERHANVRLEAFCDGVFAIALTLLIIDIRLPPGPINSTAEFWLALRSILPSIFAFLLSFLVIFITWVNHHSALSGVNKTSAMFVWANALLLLDVVAIPFPTRLMGDYILTDHAAPAVVIYNAVSAFQAVAWLLLTGSALRAKLTKNEVSTKAMRTAHLHSYFGITFYSILAVAAFWYPLAVAVISTVSWIFWLVFGLRRMAETVKD
jgi:uncharacterized membrane protein